MSPQDYFYWLQGYFELTDNHDAQGIGGLGVFTPWQVACIIKHDDLVAAQQPRGEAMIKIRAVLDMMSDQLIDPAAGTTRIRSIVAATFEHFIDPAAGGSDVQEKLNAIHSPRPPQGNGPAYRC